MRSRDGNFVLERRDDRLITSSVYSGMALAVVAWIAALAVILGTNLQNGSVDFHSPFDVFGTTILVGVGLLALLRRDISTSFEPGHRQVVQDRILGKVWRWRTRRYSFDDIAGIGIRASLGDDGDGQKSYRPIMTLKNGNTVSLTHFEEHRPSSDEILTEICAATGLPRLDVDDTEEPLPAPVSGARTG
jgi:hypothetical protein